MATGNKKKSGSDAEESQNTKGINAFWYALFPEESLAKPNNYAKNESTLTSDEDESMNTKSMTCGGSGMCLVNKSGSEETIANDANSDVGSTETESEEVHHYNEMLSDGEDESHRIHRMIWDSGKISEEDVKYAYEMLSEEEKECCRIQGLIYDSSKVHEDDINKFLSRLKLKSLNLTQKSFKEMESLLENFLSAAERFSEERLINLNNGNDII